MKLARLIRPSRRQSRFCRRGIHVVEVTMAMLVVTSLLMAVLAFSHQLRGARQNVVHRATVLQQASNVLSRLYEIPFDQLDANAIPETRDLLGDSEMLTGVTFDASVDSSDQGNAKRITVIATWDAQSGPPQRPIELSAWKYNANRD